MRVAALYIDPRGPYPKIDGVDCWDADRDARMYAGPLPIVAHPPCAHWGRLRRHAKQDTRDLAPLAVEQVRRWGGVLEHPRDSRLWDACLLPRPGELPDEFGGWSLRVDQVAWGHVARKPTWLYFVGVPRSEVRPRSGGTPTHCIGAGKRARSLRSTKDLLACSSEQARRTPPEFARWLVDAAALAKVGSTS